ncbi:MAG: histidine triad nucleotide-binding protein [Candidatus Omnitrophica bacterium]|nr:histidine triad nucleotide-binding protein [Candidatus Omnitrophota bacterium]
MKEDCIFCKIISKSIPSTIVYEDDAVMAFNDINPQAPIHAIVIPKKHIERISDLRPEDSKLISKVISAGNKIAKEKKIADSGYRFIINCNKDAGQAVFHIHMHVIGGRQMGWPPG